MINFVKQRPKKISSGSDSLMLCQAHQQNNYSKKIINLRDTDWYGLRSILIKGYS